MIYRVKDWDKHYEKAQTRKCKDMKWVAIPNKHDGAGYAIVAAHERSCELFAAWILILQTASKMATRGLLYKDGRAITPKDMSRRTRFPEDIFHLAFTVLIESDIGWLERVAGDGIIEDGFYAEDTGKILAQKKGGLLRKCHDYFLDAVIYRDDFEITYLNAAKVRFWPNNAEKRPHYHRTTSPLPLRWNYRTGQDTTIQ